MPRRPPRIFPLGLTLASLTLGGAAVAPAAQAVSLGSYAPTGHECRLVPLIGGLVAGQALADPLGYVYDTGDMESGYATLDEGTTQLLQVGTAADDAWDRFGALFVGSTQSEATRYTDPAQDSVGCNRELSSRQVAFKTVGLGRLDVTRRVFVSGTEGSGARLLDSVTNPTASPVVTNVYVGDLRDQNGGSLGSDSTTRLTATSSSDTSISTADRWAVTSDGRTIGSDPALAHVWGGPDAEEPATIVRSGAQAGGTAAIDSRGALDADQLGWGWENVALAPGETRSFLSWETMRASVDGKASTAAGFAATAAEAQSIAPLSRVYAGLTEAQIGGVRNWAKPDVDGSIEVTVGSSASDTTISAADVDFGSSKLSACTGGTLDWDFGDGTTARGTGAKHRFAAGTAQVALTITSNCGAVAVRQVSFKVAAAPAPVTPVTPVTPASTDDGSKPQQTLPETTEVPVPAPAAPQAPQSEPAAALVVTSAPILTIDVAPKLTAKDLAKRGVRTTLVANASGSARMVLSGGGLKIVKTKPLVAGTPMPAAMKLGPKDARRVKGLKTLQLRAKLTLADGTEVIASRVISVG